MQIVCSGRRIYSVAIGRDGGRCLARQVIWRSGPGRLPGRRVRCGVVMPSLAKDVGQVHLDGAGAIDAAQAISQAFAHEADDQSAGVRLAQPVAGRLRPPPSGRRRRRRRRRLKGECSHASAKPSSPRACRAWLAAPAAAWGSAVKPGAGSCSGCPGAAAAASRRTVGEALPGRGDTPSSSRPCARGHPGRCPGAIARWPRRARCSAAASSAPCQAVAPSA